MKRASILLITALLAVTSPLVRAQEPGSAKFRIHVDGLKGMISARAVFYARYSNYYTLEPGRKINAVRNGNCDFSLKIDSMGRPGYISFFITGLKGPGIETELLDAFLVDQGDQVDFRYTADTLNGYYGAATASESFTGYLGGIDQYKVNFTGHGSEKYAFRYAADVASHGPEFYEVSKDGKYLSNNAAMTTLDHELSILKSLKPNLTPLAYQVLKTDFICRYQEIVFMHLEMDKKFIADSTFLNQFPTEGISDSGAAISSEFPGYAAGRASLSCRLFHQDNNAFNRYTYLKNIFRGEARDRVLTLSTRRLFSSTSPSAANDILKDALTVVTGPVWNKQLQELKGHMADGSMAYNFKLQDLNGKWVHLSDFKGKVVFMDFWFTGCMWCHGYYKSTLSHVEDSLRDNPNIVFITVCTDKDKESWKKSVASNEYSSPNIINLFCGGVDPDIPIIQNYGVTGYPRPLVIDREGRIYKTDGLRTTVHDLIGILRQSISGPSAMARKATLRIHVDGAPENCTARMYYYERSSGQYVWDPRREIEAVRDKNGDFVLNVDSINRAGYFTFFVNGLRGAGSQSYLLLNYLIEPEDQVNVHFSADTGNTDNFRIAFSGPGSTKYTYRYQADVNFNSTDRWSVTQNGQYLPENPVMVLLKKELLLLDALWPKLSALSYYALKTDVISKSYKVIFFDLGGNNAYTGDSSILDLFPANAIPDEGKLISAEFPDYAVERAILANRLSHGSGKSMDIYNRLKNGLSGEALERMVTLYAERKFALSGGGGANDVLKDAMTIVTTPYWRQRLEYVKQTMADGSLAYNFKLEDTNGKWVQLSDFRGKVVFMDFWFTGCGPCHGFYKAILSKVEDSLANNPNVVFLTICADKDKERWKNSVATNEYSSPYIVNLFCGGEDNDIPVIHNYGVLGYPRPLIIDRDGKIYKTDGLRKPVNELISIIETAAR